MNYARDRVRHLRYERTPKGCVMRRYRSMLERTRGIGGHGYGSALGKALPAKAEFYRWSLTNIDFVRCWLAWRGSGFLTALTPSPDRRDPTRGYELDNIQWLPWHLNHAKLQSDLRRHKEALHAPH